MMNCGQEVKSLWLPFPTPLLILLGPSIELDQTRLLRIWLQPGLRQAPLKFFLESLSAFPVLKPHDEVSSPGEFHPEALSELYMNLSAHTAPTMEPRRTPICQ
jgi:hypothetical protein